MEFARPASISWVRGEADFSSVDEAAAALDAINSDYGRHCRAARDLAETQFDAKRILEGVLNATPMAREMVP